VSREDSSPRPVDTGVMYREPNACVQSSSCFDAPMANSQKEAAWCCEPVYFVHSGSVVS
jgi:hypothetical protein